MWLILGVSLLGTHGGNTIFGFEEESGWGVMNHTTSLVLLEDDSDIHTLVFRVLLYEL